MLPIRENVYMLIGDEGNIVVQTGDQGAFVVDTGTGKLSDKVIAAIDNASLIEYRQPFDLGSLFRLFGKTETPAMKVDLGINIPKLQAGQLYYIYPGFLR